MDLAVFGEAGFNLEFLSRIISIVIIDLILAGDNAVIIAMAVRSLPADQRKKGILLGAGAAVALRVACTFFLSQLLQVSFLKLGGGVLILWIAVKLFIDGLPEEGANKKATTIGQAIKLIVLADITMSVDNMLAVGGASGGNLFLLIFGLGLSIPFVVLTSNVLSMLMDKYPIIIYIGAAILGKVGAEMMITDPVVVNALAPGKTLQYSMEALFPVAVIVTGKLWMKWAVKPEETQDTEYAVTPHEVQPKG